MAYHQMRISARGEVDGEPLNPRWAHPLKIGRTKASWRQRKWWWSTRGLIVVCGLCVGCFHDVSPVVQRYVHLGEGGGEGVLPRQLSGTLIHSTPCCCYGCFSPSSLSSQPNPLSPGEGVVDRSHKAHQLRFGPMAAPPTGLAPVDPPPPLWANRLVRGSVPSAFTPYPPGGGVNVSIHISGLPPLSHGAGIG